MDLETGEHECGRIYILRVRGVSDEFGNEILSNSSYSYVYEPEDVVGPTLVLVSAVDSRHLEVMFSEEVERGSAEDVGNYRIDPAPRWNRTSDAMLVPGWTKTNTRQLFVIHLRKAQ